MFHIIDEVCSDDLVSRWWCGLVSMILEDLVCFHGLKFKFGGILPQCIAIALVSTNCMSEVFGYLLTIFELDSGGGPPKLSKADLPEHLLLPFC